jgi:hypothetical protein
LQAQQRPQAELATIQAPWLCHQHVALALPPLLLLLLLPPLLQPILALLLFHHQRLQEVQGYDVANSHALVAASATLDCLDVSSLAMQSNGLACRQL